MFGTIPLRTNGDRIDRDWFDALRTAGVNLEAFLGGGFIVETSFTLANNQSSAANVTSLLFDHTTYQSVLIYYEIRRKTSTTEVISVGTLSLTYRNLTSVWDLVDQNGFDEDGILFSITAGGQVKYTSDNMSSGTGYTGTLKFRAITFAV